jgi:N6-adenosine-specific RNA methylase IME4
VKFHALAELFPLLDGREFDELVADIATNGLREPVWLYQDAVLDGRNRWRACAQLGIAAATCTYTGDDPLAFVISLNLRRRHLTEGQRAMVAAEIAKLPKGANQHPPIGGPSMPTAAQAAEMLNVGTRSVERAREVLEHGASELVRAVKRGAISVSAAADVAGLPQSEQSELVARGEKEILNAAREIRWRIKSERKTARALDLDRQAKEILANPPALAHVVADVVVIDPPWPYGTEYDPDWRGACPYPELSLDAIREDVAKHVRFADNCVLWLWTTHQFMPDAFPFLRAWGFEHKAILTWAKNRMGLGTWLRSQTEFCILAVKGTPTVTLTNQSTLLHGPVREHSRKPDEFYALVDSLCHGTKLDFYSREPRSGWLQFGNDTQRFGVRA